MLIGGVGGRIRLLLRAASALLDASSKVAATKIENVCFMGLPPFCVIDYAMEPPKQVFHPEDPMSQLLVALARGRSHKDRAVAGNNSLQAGNTQQRAGHAAAVIQFSKAFVLEVAKAPFKAVFRHAHTPL